jgi:hypothetical protein
VPLALFVIVVVVDQAQAPPFTMTEGKPMTRVLIYGGKTGWIGGLMADLIKKEGESSVHA